MENVNIGGANNASCGAFWIANTITATFLGEKNRDLQQKMADENQAFQLQLEQMKNESQDQLEQEKIAFRRKMQNLTRQWMREERNLSLCNMEQSIQLGTYVQSFPLALPPATILNMIANKNNSAMQDPQMEVILLHTPLLSGTKGQMVSREAYVIKKETQLYDTLEYQIKADTAYLGNVNFHKDACKKFRTSNADIMNIHYLMGNTPTLVIRPKFQNGKILFTAAMWDEQATRPLIKPLFSISYNPILTQKDKEYSTEVIEKLHYIISIIVGVVRDQYALITWGKAPTLSKMLDSNENMKLFVKQNSVIQNFVLQENDYTIKSLESKNNPNVLKVYEETELKTMQKMVYEQMEYII